MVLLHHYCYILWILLKLIQCNYLRLFNGEKNILKCFKYVSTNYKIHTHTKKEKKKMSLSSFNSCLLTKLVKNFRMGTDPRSLIKRHQTLSIIYLFHSGNNFLKTEKRILLFFNLIELRHQIWPQIQISLPSCI